MSQNLIPQLIQDTFQGFIPSKIDLIAHSRHFPRFHFPQKSIPQLIQDTFQGFIPSKIDFTAHSRYFLRFHSLKNRFHNSFETLSEVSFPQNLILKHI
jgi:hypothetical protein